MTLIAVDRALAETEYRSDGPETGNQPEHLFSLIEGKTKQITFVSDSILKYVLETWVCKDVFKCWKFEYQLHCKKYSTMYYINLIH